MKLSLWDVLAILLILGTLIIGVVFVQILLNPDSNLNPLRAPTLPGTVVLPTSTNTPYLLPATWTPTGSGGANGPTLKPSSTLPPTATGVVLNTFTPTPTFTSTPTNTPTVTNTPTITNTPKPTNTAKPTSTATTVPSPTTPPP